MLKIFDLMFSTRAGKLAMRGYVLVLLLALVVLATEMPPQVIVSVLATALLILALTFKNEISRHRGSIADRACDLLPLAQLAARLVFDLLPALVLDVMAGRIKILDRDVAEKRPSPGGRIGRLPSVTLSPRLLPVPTACA